MHVYISILNWNGAERTRRCLESVYALNDPRCTILVVDNASTDDSVKVIRAAFPDVNLICSESNLGYAGGNELALRRALAEAADLFWILNNDALVEQNTLAALVGTYRKHGNALYGSVPVYRDQEGALRVGMRTQQVNGTPIHLNDLFENTFSDPHERFVNALSGSSLMIPIEIVRQHGFMDTSLFLYGEEVDYCSRLRKAGVPSILVPASRVFHEPTGSHKHHSPLKPVMLYYQTRNRLVQTRRDGSTGQYLQGLFKHVGFALMWTAYGLFRGKSALKNGRYTLMGIRDALRDRMGKTVAPEDFL